MDWLRGMDILLLLFSKAKKVSKKCFFVFSCGAASRSSKELPDFRFSTIGTADKAHV